MSSSGIHRRLKTGAWTRHYRCVYGVAGTPSTLEQRGLAACLAAGRGAALSHTSAGAMWGLCDHRPPLHALVLGNVTARPPGVVVHRTARLAPGDVGKLRRVPITSPARTIIDLAACLAEEEVEEILQRAVTSGCVSAEKLRSLAPLVRGRAPRGLTTVRRLLHDSGNRPHVASPLEKAVAAVLSDVGPKFEREYPVYVYGGVYYLDFAWPHLRVGVEADGRRWHSDAPSFERDLDRHNALTAAGWRVLRVTERQVRSDPAAVRGRVRELLVRG